MYQNVYWLGCIYMGSAIGVLNRPVNTVCNRGVWVFYTPSPYEIFFALLRNASEGTSPKRKSIFTAKNTGSRADRRTDSAGGGGLEGCSVGLSGVAQLMVKDTRLYSVLLDVRLFIYLER